MEQVINTQIYKFTMQNTLNILQKRYYKLSLHIKKFMYGVKGVCM